MKKGKHERKNKITLRTKFIFIILILLITVGFAQQERFLYHYNLQRIKSSNRISDRIEYSKKAIRHSKTEEEVIKIMELIKMNS